MRRGVRRGDLHWKKTFFCQVLFNCFCKNSEDLQPGKSLHWAVGYQQYWMRTGCWTIVQDQPTQVMDLICEPSFTLWFLGRKLVCFAGIHLVSPMSLHLRIWYKLWGKSLRLGQLWWYVWKVEHANNTRRRNHKVITLMCTMYNCGIGSSGADGFKSKILVANLPVNNHP